VFLKQRITLQINLLTFFTVLPLDTIFASKILHAYSSCRKYKSKESLVLLFVRIQSLEWELQI